MAGETAFCCKDCLTKLINNPRKRSKMTKTTKEKRHNSCQSSDICRVCKKKLDYIYHVYDEVWALSGLKPSGSVLHVECLEKRIGRKLTFDDFPGTSCNSAYRDEIFQNLKTWKGDFQALQRRMEGNEKMLALKNRK